MSSARLWAHVFLGRPGPGSTTPPAIVSNIYEPGESLRKQRLPAVRPGRKKTDYAVVCGSSPDNLVSRVFWGGKTIGICEVKKKMIDGIKARA